MHRVRILCEYLCYTAYLDQLYLDITSSIVLLNKKLEINNRGERARHGRWDLPVRDFPPARLPRGDGSQQGVGVPPPSPGPRRNTGAPPPSSPSPGALQSWISEHGSSTNSIFKIIQRKHKIYVRINIKYKSQAIKSVWFVFSIDLVLFLSSYVKICMYLLQILAPRKQPLRPQELPRRTERHLFHRTRIRRPGYLRWRRPIRKSQYFLSLFLFNILVEVPKFWGLGFTKEHGHRWKEKR